MDLGVGGGFVAGDDSVEDVPFGQEAEEVIAFHDEDGADPFVAQPVGGIQNRGIGADGDDPVLFFAFEEV